MDLFLQLGDDKFRVAMPGFDISIPMHFNGEQPNTYGVARASAKAYEVGSFVGDTRRGGACNFEEYTLVRCFCSFRKNDRRTHSIQYQR